MNSETYLDFCFIRKSSGNFAAEVDEMLSRLFKGVRLNWYLDEKIEDDMEIVVAEVKGMSKWQSEEETIAYIEEHAEETFWDTLQGYKMFIYPAKRGCGSCGTH
ncbi:hypothetical protein ACTHO0_22435 [Cytobacillus praedii]|uniref:Uncharacterized protein n=1 Tax=Cytobacillus praedii TaxID=1742358 RepID=A0A4R1AWU5_9BACI|nr:hypothetical protein [Cytobacillus praedii]MED3553323.1 hypothetical protein [Cytobacillus praedii]TCJ02364.1 hypothetical protein E0Y62_19705 [Cytobacillus praedii]